LIPYRSPQINNDRLGFQEEGDSRFLYFDSKEEIKETYMGKNPQRGTKRLRYECSFDTYYLHKVRTF